MEKEQRQLLLKEAFSMNKAFKEREVLFRSAELLELNQVLYGGFSKGLCIVGGEPAVGKTTFTLQLAREAAQQGKKVLFFSCEMTRDMLLDIIGEPIQNLGIIDLTSFNVAVEEFEDFIKDTAADIVVIDYLQLLQSEFVSNNDKTRIDNVCNEVRRFTRANNILCFCISSISRNSYSSKPDIGCFKESGSIEYSADLAFVLTQCKDTTILHIIKNRWTGVKAKIKMRLNKERVFTDETL